MPLPHRSAWPRWARVATSAWLLSPLLVFTLVIGAFFAYGAYTRNKPTHYARGGDSFALVPSESPSAAAVHHKGRTPAKKRDARGAAGRQTATAAGTAVVTGGGSTGGTSGQSSAAGHTGTGGGGTTATAGPALPATGAYTLEVDGGEHVKMGPFSACTNTFPTRSTLVVQPASGERRGSYDFDQRFYPGKANKHDERHIYRYTEAGVFLGYEQATVTCGGIKQSSTVNFHPAQQRVQLPLSAGETWSNDGGDSGRTEKATSQVVDQETVVVDGHSYDTWVIDTHVSMTGDESGTRDQRWWWSPDLAMPVKWHESLSGKRSGATYSEDVTVTVVGLP